MNVWVSVRSSYENLASFERPLGPILARREGPMGLSEKQYAALFGFLCVPPPGGTWEAWVHSKPLAILGLSCHILQKWAIPVLPHSLVVKQADWHARQDRTAIFRSISADLPPKMVPHPGYKLTHGTHLLFFCPYVYGFSLFSAYIRLIFRLFSAQTSAHFPPFLSCRVTLKSLGSGLGRANPKHFWTPYS